MQWVANHLTNKLKSYLIPSKAIAKASFTNWIEITTMFSRESAHNVRGLFILHRVNSYNVRQMFWLREIKFTNAVNFIFCSKFAGLILYMSCHHPSNELNNRWMKNSQLHVLCLLAVEFSGILQVNTRA
jgi:hypothetical protein